MFERHDQLFMEVATQYLVNAMQNFMKVNPEDIDDVRDETSAEEFVLKFLRQSRILFHFDKDGIEEDKDSDDLLTYGRDLCSRLVLSLIFDRAEKEEDPVALRGTRRTMVAYFLNRKAKVMDSKVIPPTYSLRFKVHIF